jgi:CBS domain-containing protein
VVGMLTDRDICMAGYTTGRKFTAITVASAMAKNVVSCLPTDAIVEVEKLMASEQVRRLPVLDGHRRPIGIISLNDIARASAHISRKSAAEVASTMAAVCAPRRALSLQTV